MPFKAILLLAALLAVPVELKEAAEVDGASGWQVFWHVTLPAIRRSCSWSSCCGSWTRSGSSRASSS